MISEELDRLKRLHEEGALSDEEYAEAKAIVMRSSTDSSAPTKSAMEFFGMEENTWCMAMHLSQFCTYISFGLGIAVPIVMWVASKDQSRTADNHGRVIINWLISSLIYVAVSAILCFFLIGIPMLFIFIILGLVYPIIGGLRANEGIVWRYPLSITFFQIYESAGYDDRAEYDPFGDEQRGY